MTDKEKIRFIRKSLSLNQTDFSTRIGISQAALSDIESGKNGFSYNVFRELIDKLHVNPFWIIHEIEPIFLPENYNLNYNLDYNLDTNISDTKAIHENKNRPPPGLCELCRQKDMTISALQKLITTLEARITDLEVKESLKDTDTEQKRKVG